MMRNIVRLELALLAVALVFVATGCTGSSRHSATYNDAQTASAALARFLKGQPTPSFSRSQIRQTLIEVESAQAGSVQTTTFFFNQGIKDPIQVCPSIGFPLASTSQLSNPLQAVPGKHDDTAVVGQVEPTGVFPGVSSGTYVLCVDDQGRPYANYWEGFVQTVTGAASWDTKAGRTKLVGAPTGKFTKTGG